MNIKINDSISNQDNSKIWVNPILKTKMGKLLLLIGFTPMIMLILYMDWEQIYKSNKLIFSLQILLFLISTIYVFIKYFISKITIYKIETSYNVVDDKYYREILDEDSCGVLSYVYNKKINYKDILISTLIGLEKEKILEFDYDKKYIKVLSSETTGLCEYEKYILELLRSNEKNDIILFPKLKKIILNENFRINIKGMIKKSSKEKGYYKTTDFGHSFMIYILFLNYFITLFCCFFLQNGEISILCFANEILLLFLAYIENKKIYIRTSKGKMLSQKLNGLKNYLVDFSIINERNVEDINLWDYYILYAIIFDLKGNLDKNVNALYMELKNN